MLAGFNDAVAAGGPPAALYVAKSIAAKCGTTAVVGNAISRTRIAIAVLSINRR